LKNEFAKRNRQESGQIIVLFAVSLVVILVVAALAVDGGILYSERRFAQNAADAASMAGGSAILYSNLESKNFICPAGSTYNASTNGFTDTGNLVAKAFLAARNSAGINNFAGLPYLGYTKNGVVIEDYGIDQNHGIVIACDSSTKNKYVDVQVKITAQVETSFAQLIFPDALLTTNEAVTRVEPGHNFGYGNAIVSLSKTCQNTGDGGTYFHGSAATIKIKGAGTHSNSCLVGSGNNLEVIIDEDKDLNLVDSDADENPAGIFPYNGNQPILDIDYPEEPVCGTGTSTSVRVTNTTVTLSPGNYSEIDISGGNVTFSPGLYCLTGDISITGGKSVGDGVTFYVKGTRNDVTITGNATALLAAPSDPENILFGMLFFMDDANTGTIKLVGTNGSYFSGVVYSPNGFIDIGGTSSTTTYSSDLCAKITTLLEETCEATTFSTQIIGKSVRVKGDGKLDILYNESALPGVDSNMFLLK
jgi:hypothetical protein